MRRDSKCGEVVSDRDMRLWVLRRRILKCKTPNFVMVILHSSSFVELVEYVAPPQLRLEPRKSFP